LKRLVTLPKNSQDGENSVPKPSVEVPVKRKMRMLGTHMRKIDHYGLSTKRENSKEKKSEPLRLM